MSSLFLGAVERLRAAGIDNPRLDARVLLEHARTNPPREGGSKNPKDFSGRGISPAPGMSPFPKFAAQISTLPQGEGGIAERFEEYIQRRVAREPVAYITGHKEFWSLDFEAGPGALIPRPETETLIEQMLKHFPDREAPLDILDLGTGSGCLLIAALSEYPHARGTGIDSSPQALAWARRNVERHESNARLIEGDFTAASGSPDVILCNPPYIKARDIAALAPEVRLFEPVPALDGGADGLDAYRSLALLIGRLLKPAGLAFLEIGAGQNEAVTAILGGKMLGIVPDLTGIARCVIGRNS